MDFIPTRRMIKAAETARGSDHDAAVGLFRVWFDHTSLFILIWLAGALIAALAMGLAESVLDPAMATGDIEAIGGLIGTALLVPLIIWFVARRPRHYAYVRFGTDLARVHTANWFTQRPVVEWLEPPVHATFQPRPRGMAQRVIIGDLILFTRDRANFAKAQKLLGPNEAVDQSPSGQVPAASH